MRKGIVHSTDDDLFEECEKRVVISQDEYPPDPLHEYDQIFLFHSMINRYLCGNEGDDGYEDPRVEDEDDDGVGTGECKLKDDAIGFYVSAYIHGGVALHMGTVMCAFGDSYGPNGVGWDTCPNAAFMWTDKERFERLCCEDGWMTVFDEKTRRRRPAKDRDEFVDYLYGIAEGELKLLQDYIEGRCYWYKTEVKEKWHKKFENGTELDGYDWEDDGDSCGGYYVEKVGDIEFPKGDGWEVFADDSASNFVGDEYDIHEYVVAKDHKSSGKKMFLSGYCEDSEGNCLSNTWTFNVDEALTFMSWYKAQNVARKFIEKDEYDANKNCVEKDEIKKQMENAA